MAGEGNPLPLGEPAEMTRLSILLYPEIINQAESADQFQRNRGWQAILGQRIGESSLIASYVPLLRTSP
jgi:hypothetical protein